MIAWQPIQALVRLHALLKFWLTWWLPPGLQVFKHISAARTPIGTGGSQSARWFAHDDTLVAWCATAVAFINGLVIRHGGATVLSYWASGEPVFVRRCNSHSVRIVHPFPTSSQLCPQHDNCKQRMLLAVPQQKFLRRERCLQNLHVASVCRAISPN